MADIDTKTLMTTLASLKEGQRILKEKIEKLETIENVDAPVGKQISELPEVTSISDIDLLPLVQDNVTSKTSIRTVNSHLAEGFQTTRKKVIEIAGTEQELTVDLSPHKTYSKFHIEFPSSRSHNNITVSITGIQDLLYGIESITMSGLDNDGTFVTLSKQGTITFTLDSTDYEFPASIYHFGGFETGNGRIFLHIDYMEAKIGSTQKYMIENAIYGDAKLFDINKPADSDGEYLLSNHYKDNSTYLIKHNGELSKKFYSPNSGTSASLPDFVAMIMSTIIGASEMPYHGELSFYSHVLNIPLMPILKPTGIIAYNGAFYGAILLQRKKSISIVGTAGTKTYSTELCSYYAPKDVIWDYHDIRTDLTNTEYWDTIPTEFGMYRVTVKGTYLQGLHVA